MSLIVEDGTIVANANSYISAANFSAYAAARGITLVGDPTTLLTEAMDYIEGLVYKGIKRTIGQSLQWPRVDVYIDTYYLQADTLPIQLLNGQCWTAIAIDQGTDLMQDLPRRVLSEKVGSIEVHYAPGAASNVYNIKIHNALWKILDNGSGTGFRVGKG